MTINRVERDVNMSNVLAIRKPIIAPHDRDDLTDIAKFMHSARDLSAAESALDCVSDALDMPWPCWVFDISNPYYCPHEDAFSRDRGWPDELQQFWWKQNATLKMPFYIRCRFQHLPFVTALNRQIPRRSPRASHEHQRVHQFVHDLGITSMLTVPVHLPKGQIAMITWAGSRDTQSLNALLGSVTGDLLAIGHHFMRIYHAQFGQTSISAEEHARLTPREWDCMRTWAQGYREAEVAKITGITRATVRYHINNVVQKLGCKTRAHAVALAAQLGLLGPVGP